MSGRHEEEMDARLREALRGAVPAPPVDEVDWGALRERIARDAAPALARLRQSAPGPRSWWDYAARWAVPALPAALAAAAALALLLGRLSTATPQTQPEVASASATRLTVENAIGASPSDAEVTALYASADRDALLRAAVSGETSQ